MSDILSDAFVHFEDQKKSAWVAAKVNCVVVLDLPSLVVVNDQPRGLWMRFYLGELIRSARR